MKLQGINYFFSNEVFPINVVIPNDKPSNEKGKF